MKALVVMVVGAVVVALVEPGATDPGSLSKTPVFRFSTEDGRTVETRSESWSYPGPKVGAQIPIVYDPARPEQSAERAGVRSIQLVLAPVIAVLGVVLIGFGIRLLG